MAPFAPMRLGIVGVGLIGGSVGLAARRAWPRVHRVGVDDGDVLDAALTRGCVDARAASAAELADCDLVILATPVPAILGWLEQWPADHPATLTDTGSTKRQIVAAAAHIPGFTGGHPLAGRERGGVDASTPELFDGCDWILTPGPGCEQAAATQVRAFITGLGARPREMAPDDHDRVMAFVSHVPQLLSVALMNAAARAGVTRHGLAGGGFRDMTRLAGSPGELWQGILASNADYVADAIAAVSAALPEADRDLDLARVRREFEAAGRARQDLFGKDC